MRLTPQGRNLVVSIIVLGAVFGGRYAYKGGYLDSLIPKPVPQPSSVPPAPQALPRPTLMPLPETPKAEPVKAQPTMPSVTPPKVSLPVAARPPKLLIWAWNAQQGLLYANGGGRTVPGSILSTKGVDLLIERQDDVSQMQNELIACAKELSEGQSDCGSGTNFVAIMGDGAPAFITSANATLARLGSEYQLEIVGSAGYSRGEDKLMGPCNWVENPNLARGGLISGVLRDGDWNIAMVWAATNDLCNNPDETTYDPNCLNWYNPASYIDAGQKYIEGSLPNKGICEERRVVSNGKLTNEKKTVCIDAVTSWTPVDVTIATKKGGLCKIVSTLEYSSQMPNVIIGIKAWNQNHADYVSNMLSGVFEGGDAIKGKPGAREKAAEISARVYREETPEYWHKYFDIQRTTDVQGIPVELGGSSVNNLADNQHLFGLLPGSTNVYASVYDSMCAILTSQYPALFASCSPVESIVNTRYIQAAAAKTKQETAEPDVPTFRASAPIVKKFGKKVYYINFDFGKDTFRPEAYAELEKIKQSALIASNLAVEIHGYTDNVGSDAINQKMSERRAEAVRTWLNSQSSLDFGPGRVRIYGHGKNDPVASNDTEAGRAENRRVEIVLGETN